MGDKDNKIEIIKETIIYILVEILFIKKDCKTLHLAVKIINYFNLESRNVIAFVRLASVLNKAPPCPAPLISS